MRKLTYAAVVLPILLVATAPAHAGDGRAFHSSRPVSPHAGLVSPGAVLVTPHPVLVAPPHAFVGPRVFVGVGVGTPFWRTAYAYPYPAYTYPTPTLYAQSYVPRCGWRPARAELRDLPTGRQRLPRRVVPPEPAYWYYCTDYGAYYPYVQRCPTEWLKVVPQPAP